MSRQVTPYNRLEITSGVLSRIQVSKDELISGRLLDSVSQPGIATPVGATARYLQAGCVYVNTGDPATQFTITPAVADKFTLGAGVAYDVNGNRIEILSGDGTTFNPNAPLFAVSITGVAPIQPVAGPIPYSTGRINAFDRGAGPPYVTPDTSDGERFVFVRYREVVLTKALPSNHAAATQTAVSLALTGASPNTQKPYTELDEKEGLIYAPHRVDGYEVIVVPLTGLTVGSQPTPNTPVLAADPNAIYVGRYEISGGIILGTPILHDNDRPRRLLQLRSREVGVVPGDRTKGPAVYADTDQPVTLQEHVSALGTAGTVSPTNPHGLSISDIEGGGLEPQNRQYQADSLADGIIDPNVTQNNPIPSPAAFEPQIVNVAVGSWLARVEFASVTGSSIYLLGTRIAVEDVPTTEGPTIIGKVTMGFIAGSPGTYTIYVGLDITNPLLPTITLGKTTSFPPTPPSATIDYFPLATVYWTGAVLRKALLYDSSSTSPTGDLQEATLRPRDQRTIGLVSTEQIATEGLSDPLGGLLARQTFRNVLINPDFLLSEVELGSGSSTVAYGWTLNQFAPVSGSAQAKITTSSSAPGPTLPTDNPGPKSISANKLTFPASIGGGILHVQLLGSLSDLRPNTVYTITAWFKVTAQGAPSTPSNSTIFALGRLTNGAGTTSYTGTLREFILNNALAAWQRVTIVLQTDSNPSALVASKLDIRFISQNPPSATYAPADIYIAGVMVMEGEWTLGKGADLPRVRRLFGAGFNIGGVLQSPNWSHSFTQTILAATPIISTGRPMVLHAHMAVQHQFSFNTQQNMWWRQGALHIMIDGAGSAVDDQLHRAGAGTYANEIVSWSLNTMWIGILSPGPHTIGLRFNGSAEIFHSGNQMAYFSNRDTPILEVLEL